MQLKRVGPAFDRIYRKDQNENLEKIEQANNTLESKMDSLISGKIDDVALQTDIEQKLNDLETQYAPELTSVSEQLVDITINVKSFGAIGDGSTDDTDAIQNAVNYCILNKKRLYFPEGTFITTSDIVVTGYIVIFGSGKNSIIKCNGLNANLFRVEFPSSSTVNYTYSNLEIKDLYLYGNKNATVQHAICFNSVICIYNKLTNISFEGFRGSAIRLINDGSRANKSFYSHNVYWEGLYLYSTSEVITQETINNGTIPWVYGGSIKDVHVEQSCSFRGASYLVDLKGFHNLNIDGVVCEGRVLSSFKAFFYADDSMTFNNPYFEPVLNPGVSIECYFEFGNVGVYEINKPMNLNVPSAILTSKVGAIAHVIGGIFTDVKSLHHPSSVGELILKSPKIGSFYSGLMISNVVPTHSNTHIENLSIGSYKTEVDLNSEIYRLNKGEFISNYFQNTNANFSLLNPGTSPTMTVDYDSSHGRYIKLVPTTSTNSVYTGLSFTVPQHLVGKKYTVTARYKWIASRFEKTDPRLIGSLQSVLHDNADILNDTWRVSSVIGPLSATNYVRMDYNSTHSNPHTLCISDIVIVLGEEVRSLPLRDDRPTTFYGASYPTSGVFKVGDECLNNLASNTSIYKWVYTTQGWKAVNF